MECKENYSYSIFGREFVNKEDNLKKLLHFLEAENIAYDINSYRDAPLGIRIWGGATINHKDIEILLDWLEWGYYEFIAKG